MNSIRTYFSEAWASLLSKDGFAKNVAFMFGSSGAVILVQILLFPIISRLYSPEDYGLFGIFNALASSLFILSTLALTDAFVLPKKEVDFRNILSASLLSVAIISCLSFLICLVAKDQILYHFDAEQMGWWLLLIGPTVMIMGLARIFQDWVVREKRFTRLAKFNLLTAVISKSSTIGVGLINPSVGGLIIGHMISYLGQVVIYPTKILGQKWRLFRQQLSNAKPFEGLVKFWKYPVLVLPGKFLNLISGYLPTLLLPLLGFSIQEVGWFTFSLIILDIPIRLLGGGITPVFLQKANAIISHLNGSKQELLVLTEKVYVGISLLVIIPMIMLLVWGEPIYSFLFGAEWRIAGRVAELMTIYYLFRLVSAPISCIFNVLRKEGQLLLFQVLLFLVRLVSLLIPVYFYDVNFIELMFIYGLGNASVYFIYHIWIFSLLRGGLRQVLLLPLVFQIIPMTLAWYFFHGMS